MRTAELVIVHTSPECLSYRLTDAAGRVLWSNRVYAIPEGDAGARRRLEAWAAANGYTVAESPTNPESDQDLGPQRREVQQQRRRA